ncbi:uncharacterized protein LOC117783807 [Drosophila innubila]|uniref:uncharacterized protein LOC117783807 n=1 Tax=Drosophila innubila TaxID=198719 RepID=UPI00148C0C25|nr:uncharacterized protein LOC117783807 [Drosophila innubila]
MSTSSKLTLSLGEQQLAKLTNEAPEIRMRALEQVETRFIRCLQHGETINFKPVLLLKQLIRWFGHTPPAAADRVLALMLELLRSDYVDAIVHKIPCQRLLTELEKIRKILGCMQSKRALELLDDLQSLVAVVYNEATPVESNLSSGESQSSSSEMEEFSIEKFKLSPADFEPAWARANLDDMATMKTIVDSLTIDIDLELLDHLTNLQIKLCDYPAEYLLQTPHIFLRLLHIQRKHANKVLLQINRTLLTTVKLLQRRLKIRSKTLYYSASIESPETSPQQLCIPSALMLLVNGCLELLGPPQLEVCRHNWHLIELIVEVIATFCQMSAPIPNGIVERLGLVVPNLLDYCGRFSADAGSNNELTNLTRKVMIPRLQSLIFNGLLMDVISLNMRNNPEMDKVAAQALLQPIMMDSVYLTCVPLRMQELSNLCNALKNGKQTEKQQMLRLKQAYSSALNQLVARTRLAPKELLHEQRQMCLVLIQLGSEKLLKQLCQAIVKCSSFYGIQPDLRQEAESLLSTLFDLPDQRLRGTALRLLKQPVVEHFHGFLNNTNYLTGCSNIELARQHILGLPMSTHLLRKLLVHAWMPHQAQQAQLQLQQWCIDYLIMLLGLAKLVDTKDFNGIFKIVLPVMPLIICRAINYPQLQQLLFELLNPDADYLDPPQSMRGNVCYLYHPDAEFRKEAQTRVAYALMLQDHQNKYRPIPDQVCLALMGPDLCLVRPPLDYSKLFSERMNLPFMRSLQALLRLLETPDIKPGIRRSTLIQLNVLLHNWQAVEAFTDCDGSYMLCLNALHNPLLRDRTVSVTDADSLQPAVSILLRVLFRSEHFRQEFKDNAEILVCLLRCLYLHPLEAQLRIEVSVCIFQLLFHELSSPTEEKLVMDVDLSPLMVPVSYEKDYSSPPTAATEGIALQDHLLAKYFEGNEALAAQHWRLHTALKICGSPEDMKLSALHCLDVSSNMKLRTADLALVQASLVDVQLQNQLVETGNCSNHEMLHKYVASIHLFLMFLQDKVPPAVCNNLWKLMHKYLKLSPGNEADRELYTALLDLCLSCLRHDLPRVPMGLCTALETDPHHSFFVILRDTKVSLNLLHLVTDCLVQLLSEDHYQGHFTWYSKLFMELSALARTHFEERNLQHVRCLLRVLSKLSECPLDLDDNKLQIYYQHFVQLSSNLRTSTQTGAQWQRDCLLVICQLHAQSQSPLAIGGKSGCGTKVLRYLLGLCGHGDGEVRALAWVSLANWIRSSGDSMVSILLEFVDALPGGLAACCLSTLQDGHELMLVRELAARVFELLMPHIGATACCELLKCHSFLQEAHKALATLQLYPNLKQKPNKEPPGTQNSCEIIGCYVSICVNLVLLQPTWCATLCEHAFVNALSDVLKLKTPDKPHQRAYLELCAGQICKLYAVCYQQNFEFLQRSICRDTALLKSFFALMGDVLWQDGMPEHQLVQILKLLMVFCKDQNAFEFLCDQFRAHPDLFTNLMLFGLNPVYVQEELQRYTLATLSLVLIKAQVGKEEHNLLTVFASYEEEDSDTDNEDKENNINALNRQLKMSLSLKKQKALAKCFKGNTTHVEFTNGIVFLYHALDQLFDLHYPATTFSFLQPASKSHSQICEVLGNLLKQSTVAVDTARNYGLLEHVVQLLETFLDDASVGNATVYVRRVGAHKSRDIINNLLVLLNMMMHWHNSPQAVITDAVMAARVVRVLLRLWPWLSHSAILKHMTVRLTTFLTEHSFEMCKQTSQVLSSQSHSLLQLMVRVADHETTKKELPGAKNIYLKCNSHAIIEAALRVMINCCSCAEGRLSLGKMRVLDMFDTILPATNNNVSKVKPDVLLSWLTFWEIFSRYELGYKICHMPALLNTVRRSPPLSKVRKCCLRILRNMCFCNSNRTQLVGMTQFMNLLGDIVCQPVRCLTGGGDTGLESFEEHNLVILCLWKLFGFSAKYRALLRASKLFKQLTILCDQLAIMESQQRQLFKAFPFASEVNNMLWYLFEALNP